MTNAVLWLVDTVIGLLIFILIVQAILSWLIAFDIVNRRNRVVDTIWDISTRLTEPLLKPIRAIIPPIGGLDLSPLVLILALGFVQRLIPSLVYSA